MNNTSTKNIIIAFFSALLFIIIFWYAYHYVFPDGIGRRIFKLLGGDILNGGYIQFLTFFTFIWALLEIRTNLSDIRYEAKSFNMDILPTQEHLVLNPGEIKKMRLEAVDFEKKHSYLLSSMVVKAYTKFIRTNSVAEMQNLISSQIKINQSKAESRQSIIRYLLWAMPSLGFIGTVIGISNALGLAGEITDGNTKVVTETLGVAFDTTLIALMLSIVAMWSFHQLQAKEDELHANMEEFAISNLVNRIDTQSV